MTGLSIFGCFRFLMNLKLTARTLPMHNPPATVPNETMTIPPVVISSTIPLLSGLNCMLTDGCLVTIVGDTVSPTWLGICVGSCVG